MATVNTDGTLSRIANWNKMTEVEQQHTQRVIAARNKQRIAALNDAHTQYGDSTQTQQPVEDVK